MTTDALHDTASMDQLAPVYLLAFEEAGRALDAQERAVNELRSRVGILMASAAVATSFFGSQTIDHHRLDAATWIALIAFALVGASVLTVLWPRHDWQFHADAADLISEYGEPDPVRLPLIHRDLALHRSAGDQVNARQLRWLFVTFRAGLLVLVIEVAAWLVALAGAA